MGSTGSFKPLRSVVGGVQLRHLSGGTIAVLGLVLAAIQTVHAVAQTDVPLAVAVDAVPLVLVALALPFVGIWLARESRDERDATRVVAWSFGGAVVFVSFAALSLFAGRVVTGDLTRAQYVAIDHLTIGATSGALVGLYDIRSRQRLRALRTERDRVESFAQKAADMNNYGRAIARCTAVSGVSAFCIEAVATLLGVRETAVLELSGDQMRVVGDTTADLARRDLRGLADAALESEVGSVTVSDGPPDLDPPARIVITAVLARSGGTAAVLVSPSDDVESVGDEDRQLLELLVSHAGATLESIYAVDGTDDRATTD